jgi:hypothetical protein
VPQEASSAIGLFFFSGFFVMSGRFSFHICLLFLDFLLISSVVNPSLGKHFCAQGMECWDVEKNLDPQMQGLWFCGVWEK